MKITKRQLRQIIKEEIGLMDTVANKLGYEKKQAPMGKKIEAVRRKVIEYPIDELMDEIHDLGITDEIGEEGSTELALWNAISNVYQSFMDLSSLLDDARTEALK